MANSDRASRPVPNIRSTKPDRDRLPDIRQVNSIVLHEGPRTRKEVVHLVIQSRNTGEFKSHSIGFRTKHHLQGQWQKDSAKSFTLDGDDQIRNAVRFILASCEGNIPDIGGKFLIVPAPRSGDIAGLQRVITTLSQKGKADLLVELLSQASRTPELLDHLMQQAARNPQLFMEAAAAINLVRYRKAVERLSLLIERSASELDFQRLLAENPWMFGSEYSALWDRRKITRDEQADFLLRRTTDNYIELIEIKTPLAGKPLFIPDDSHGSYYARSELSQVIGQVQKYLEEADRTRDYIARRDETDPLKVRAKIIVGRDGDEAQRQALRIHNAYMHRIEIMTFDHLRRIAERVVGYLERAVPQRGPDQDEVPL